MTDRELIEGYFRIRRDSPALKRDAERFEGTRWHGACREKDGHIMTVYEIEGDIEVCIIFANGKSKTYS